MDFLIPRRDTLLMVESKAGRTVRSADAAALGALSPGNKRLSIERLVVHRAASTLPMTRVVAPGVSALTLDAFVARINA